VPGPRAARRGDPRVVVAIAWDIACENETSPASSRFPINRAVAGVRVCRVPFGRASSKSYFVLPRAFWTRRHVRRGLTIGQGAVRRIHCLLVDRLDRQVLQTFRSPRVELRRVGCHGHHDREITASALSIATMAPASSNWTTARCSVSTRERITFADVAHAGTFRLWERPS
jgi:hypothetical protein